MPYSGYHLGGCGVSQAEIIDEIDNSRGVRGPLGVPVSPFGCVAKEGRVAERVNFFPVPFPWIPGKVFNKACFKDPKCFASLVGGKRISGHLEGSAVSFL